MILLHFRTFCQIFISHSNSRIRRKSSDPKSSLVHQNLMISRTFCPSYPVSTYLICLAIKGRMRPQREWTTLCDVVSPGYTSRVFPLSDRSILAPFSVLSRTSAQFVISCWLVLWRIQNLSLNDLTWIHVTAVVGRQCSQMCPMSTALNKNNKQLKHREACIVQ